MSTIYKRSFLNSIGVLAYITLVALIMQNGDKLFGDMDNSWFGPIVFLLLFTLSALIVGILILGKPIMLYLDGQKKEAVSMLGSSVLWLALFTIVFLLIVILIK